MFTWLSLSARVLTSLPSTVRLINVSGPTQCVVGPSLKREEVQCVVTHAVTSMVVDLLGWAPCSLGPPPWSLNAPCAMFPCGGSPVYSGQ